MKRKFSIDDLKDEKIEPPTGPLINWAATDEESALIAKIAVRAVKSFKKAGIRIDKLDVQMDVAATHLNGNPLRLEDFLNADDLNFAHDICKIRRHLNRETGKLENHFLPRFTKKEG